MSDPSGIDRPARGIRLMPTLVLIVLAFAIGAALAVYLLHRIRLAAPPTAPAAVARPATALVAVQTPAAAQVDPVTLATRETTLAAQLAAIEARTALIDATSRSAGGQAARAEAVLTAAAVRRVIDQGLPLGYLEVPLRVRFGQVEPGAVTVIDRAARQPVTLDSLRAALDARASDLLVGQAGDWLDRWQQELGRLVVIRRAGTPVATPASRLERARLLLEGGQVEAARAEVAQMPGGTAAADWQAAAARYVLAHRALDRIERVAIGG